MLAEFFYERALDGQKWGGVDMNLALSFHLAAKGRRHDAFMKYAVERAKERGLTFRQSRKALAKVIKARIDNKEIEQTALAGYVASCASHMTSPLDVAGDFAQSGQPLRLSSQALITADNIFEELLTQDINPDLRAALYDVFEKALNLAALDLGPLRMIEKMENILSSPALHDHNDLSWIIENFLEEQIEKARETEKPEEIARALLNTVPYNTPPRMTHTLAQQYYNVLRFDMQPWQASMYAELTGTRFSDLDRNHPFIAKSKDVEGKLWFEKAEETLPRFNFRPHRPDQA